MATRREMVKASANRKGFSAGVSAVATAGAVAVGLMASAPILAIGFGLVGGAITVRKTLEWLRYRGEYGLKF